MRHNYLLRFFVSLTFAAYVNFSHAEDSQVQNKTEDDSSYEVGNPLRVTISHEFSVDKNILSGTLVYENPVDSKEDAIANRSYQATAWQLTYEGKFVDPVKSDRSGVKPQPLTDSNFQHLKPGEKLTKPFSIDLNQYQMLGGKHQYQLRFAMDHVLPSVEDKIYKTLGKIAYNRGGFSNTITFTYTVKPPKLP